MILVCTAISARGIWHLFGRTLDLEKSYQERVMLLPRHAELHFLREKPQRTHHAILGMALQNGPHTLFFDAVNEHGLCIAALNFPGEAQYHVEEGKKYAVASYELIPWLLGRCRTVSEAKVLLRNCCITADSVSVALPATPLHWLIADANASLVVEPVQQGLTLYDDPWGVLTNAPSFPHHVSRLADHMQLSASEPQNKLCPDIPVQVYANGLGAMGLPGDFSSASRFVRAVFASGNTWREDTKRGSIHRFFHVMDTVSVPNGCIVRGDGKPIRTVYTSCMDARRMRYYYTTYGCRGIRCVAPAQAALDGERPVRYGRVSCEDQR